MGRYRIRPGRFFPALIVTFCVAGLVLWGLWGALAWARGAVLQQVLDVRFMVRDELVQAVPARGLLIRSEEPVQAPAPGELVLQARDGERLRVGSLLAEVQGVERAKVYSSRAGVFCTHVDGLETLLAPDMVDKLDLVAVEKIEPGVRPAGEPVDSGQFFGKVVDNLQPVLVHIRAEEPGSLEKGAFRPGGTAHLVYKDRELAGRINEVRDREGTLELLVEISDYPDEFIHQRRLEFELVTRRLEGWLVPTQAVVFKEGAPGIYVVNRQRLQWIPVSVDDRIGDTVAVSGDRLNEALRYVSNPGWAREGTRLGNGS